MSDMPTPDQQSNITAAISAARGAQKVLQQQIDAASDTSTEIELTNHFNALDALVEQLVHAQNSTDDQTLTKAVAALKSQTSALQAVQARVKKIISDVGLAEKIVGYITKALGFIAKL
jgi:hypothetical protein